MSTSENETSYSSVTRGVHVKVTPAYMGYSLPQHPGYHLFTYHVTITNQSERPVQLLRRHWYITDGHGQVEQVRGAGVIGKRPTILPGRSHEYSSYCPMKTEVGSMRGSYQMVTDGGDFFDAEIPVFPLVTPGARN